MITQAQAQAHALGCGVDMTDRIAIPVADVADRFPAIDILHPETQEVYWPAGFWIKEGDEHWFSDLGMDYVICELNNKD